MDTPTCLAYIELPGLTVSTGLVGNTPVGVRLIGGRYREDVLLAAGAARATVPMDFPGVCQLIWVNVSVTEGIQCRSAEISAGLAMSTIIG